MEGVNVGWGGGIFCFLCSVPVCELLLFLSVHQTTLLVSVCLQFSLVADSNGILVYISNVQLLNVYTHILV